MATTDAAAELVAEIRTALRCEDPLPMPAWVGEIHEAVSEALAGQAGAR